MPAADFVALATLLAGPAPEASPQPAPPPSIDDDAFEDVRPEPLPDEIRRFRARVLDALDARVEDLVREIAVHVVARELRAAPCDLAALVERLAHERCADGPLRVRIAPADAHIAVPLPVVIDATLAAGDAILECRSGTVDARLGTRLAALLEAR